MATKTKPKAVVRAHQRAVASVCITLDDTAPKAPTELRMWGPGWTQTDYGRFLLDQKAADAIMAQYASRGNRLTWYFGHPETDGRKAEDRKSAGSFALEVRETEAGPELWMVDIQWADGVADMIARKEWLYFSPSCAYDVDTRRIEEIYHCALTNEPATHKARLLAADRTAVGAELADQLAAAIGEAYGAATILEVEDTWVVYELDGRVWKVEYEVADGVASLVGEPEDITDTYEPRQTLAAGPADERASKAQAAIDDMLPPTDTVANEVVEVADDWIVYRRDERLWKIGYKNAEGVLVLVGDPEDVTDSYTPAGSAELARKSKAAPNVAEPTLTARTLLDLTGAATLPDAIKRIRQYQQSHNALLRVTCTSNTSAALGTVEAWKQAGKQLRYAQAEIAVYYADAAKTKVASLLADAKRQRKITPAMVAHLQTKGLSDPAWLEAHLAHLPTLPAGQPVADSGMPKVPRTYASMSHAERVKLYNEDPATFHALRSQYVKSGSKE